MKHLVCILLGIFTFAHFTIAQFERPVGINLAGIEDWSSEYPFVDAFKQSREWIPHEYGWGVPWSSNVDIPLGPNGYPLEIPYDDGMNPPQGIRALMFFGDLVDHYPGGEYRLIVDGTGQVTLWGAATGTFKCPVDTMVLVDNGIQGVALEIDTSLVTDRVRNIRFIMPGYGDSYETEPFNPELLDFIEDFQTIRFMDWMKTNGSPVADWSDRSLPTDYTQTLDNGVAYEHIIELCNLTGKNAWICVPHKANDNYVTELARFLRDGLDPELKIYVEYSNEVWNSIFSQSDYADSMGNVLGYAGNPWEQGWQFYAKRCADIFHIFETEFGGDDRLVKVVSAQAVNSWVQNYILERFSEPTYNPNQVSADALAIAPYFAGSVADDIGNAGLIATTTIDDILDSMEISLPNTFSWMDESKIVADTHQLQLMAYEGGQHLVASHLYNNDTAYVNKLTAVNHHPRMRDFYCEYFEYWYDSVDAGMFGVFSSHSLYGKHGSWGVKEFMDDTLNPKYIGLQECVFILNEDTLPPSSVNHVLVNDKIKIYPVPTFTQVVTVEHDLNRPKVAAYNLIGQVVETEITHLSEERIEIRVSDFEGMGKLMLSDKERTLVRSVVFLSD